MTEYLDLDDLMRPANRVIDGEVKVRDAGRGGALADR